MQPWYPRAVKNPAVKDAGPMGHSYGWKLVIHTTESTGKFQPSTTAYGSFGHTYYPHLTLDRDGKIYQHIGIDRAARALKGSTKVETNRARAVQVECIGQSSDDPKGILTVLQVEELRRLFDWLDTQVPIARVALPAGTILGSATTTAPQRLSPADWERFSGVCGHRHVPANSHWDPGAFDLSRILPDPTPTPTPPEEDDDMSKIIEVPNSVGSTDLYHVSGVRAIHVGEKGAMEAAANGATSSKWKGTREGFIDAFDLSGQPLPR